MKCSECGSEMAFMMMAFSTDKNGIGRHFWLCQLISGGCGHSEKVKECAECYYWGECSKQCLVDDWDHESSKACREHGHFHFQPRPDGEKVKDGGA